jgi:hypothetical protein
LDELPSQQQEPQEPAEPPQQSEPDFSGGSIDIDGWCEFTYGGGWKAGYGDLNDPDSWYCTNGSAIEDVVDLDEAVELDYGSSYCARLAGNTVNDWIATTDCG